MFSKNSSSTSDQDDDAGHAEGAAGATAGCRVPRRPGGRAGYELFAEPRYDRHRKTGRPGRGKNLWPYGRRRPADVQHRHLRRRTDRRRCGCSRTDDCRPRQRRRSAPARSSCRAVQWSKAISTIARLRSKRMPGLKACPRREEGQGERSAAAAPPEKPYSASTKERFEDAQKRRVTFTRLTPRQRHKGSARGGTKMLRQANARTARSRARVHGAFGSSAASPTRRASSGWFNIGPPAPDRRPSRCANEWASRSLRMSRCSDVGLERSNVTPPRRSSRTRLPIRQHCQQTITAMPRTAKPERIQARERTRTTLAAFSYGRRSGRRGQRRYRTAPAANDNGSSSVSQ